MIQAHSLKLNKMKKLSMLILALMMFTVISAQEKIKQKEVGLVFNSLNKFGLTYKTGNQKSLWRFTTLFITGNYTESTVNDHIDSQSRNGIGFKFGKEFRKPITDKLDFRYGADLSFSYAYTYSKTSSSETIKHAYTPGINLVLGINYALNEHFIIGAELLPFFRYSVIKDTSKHEISDGEITEIDKDYKAISTGLDNSSAMLSLMYRF